MPENFLRRLLAGLVESAAGGSSRRFRAGFEVDFGAEPCHFSTGDFEVDQLSP